MTPATFDLAVRRLPILALRGLLAGHGWTPVEGRHRGGEVTWTHWRHPGSGEDIVRPLERRALRYPERVAAVVQAVARAAAVPEWTLWRDLGLDVRRDEDIPQGRRQQLCLEDLLAGASR